MTKKETIAQWPEVKELIAEARLDAVYSMYDSKANAVEFAIRNTLAKIHSICMCSPAQYYRMFFDPIDLHSKFPRLSSYWCELERQTALIAKHKEAKE